MYLHPLSIFSTIYRKIDDSSLLVCMTKQKSTQSKLRLSCRGTNIWIIPIVSQTAKQAEWEREKEIEKGQTEGEKTIDIYTFTLIYTYVITMVQYFKDLNFMYPFQMFVSHKRDKLSKKMTVLLCYTYGNWFLHREDMQCANGATSSIKLNILLQD